MKNVIILFMYLLFIPIIAFSQSSQVQTQKLRDIKADYNGSTDAFYFTVKLPNDCKKAETKQGTITKFVKIDGVDKYFATNKTDHKKVVITGEFGAKKTYQITIDGMLCNRNGINFLTQGNTSSFPAQIEFLSKGLFFSERNPVVLFRHRNKLSVDWKIYRIEKEYRHLFSLTEDVKISRMENNSPVDITIKDVKFFKHLKDFPGEPKKITQPLGTQDSWMISEIDLSEMAKIGDWFLVVSEENKINKLVQFTNIGLEYHMSSNYMWVRTVQLDTGAALSTSVNFKNKHNRILTTIQTDATGIYTIEDVGKQFKNKHFDFKYIDVVHNNDNITAPFNRSSDRIPLDTLQIQGDNPRIKAFVYSDRGLYRRGEKANITAMYKDYSKYNKQISRPQFKLIGPSGTLKKIDLSSHDFAENGYTWTWDIPDDAQTGQYQVVASSSGSTRGVVSFAVEQIIPPTLEGSIQFAKTTATYDHDQHKVINGTGELTSKFLFGAPASGKRFDYQCLLERKSLWVADYPKYKFHDGFKHFPSASFYKETDLSLDFEGHGKVSCDQSIPEDLLAKLPGAAGIKVIANIYEEGGRFIEAVKTTRLYTYKEYPGVQPLFKGKLGENEAAGFNIIAYDPVNKKLKEGVNLRIRVYEKDYWGWYYFHRSNEPVIDSEITRMQELEETITTTSEPYLFSFNPPRKGEWEIEISVEGSENSTRLMFKNRDWKNNAGLDKRLTQEVTFTPDKKQYEVGDIARILVTAPFDGSLLMRHEIDGKVLHSETIAVVDKKAEYQFTIDENNAPWTFLTGTLLRTIKAETETKPLAADSSTTDGDLANLITPYRAIGLLPLPVKKTDEVVKFDIKAPKQGRPESNLPLEIQALNTDGTPLSETVYLTVAVVDEGILQLAKYKTPNPYPYFHKRPPYRVAWYDTFGKVIPYSLHKGQAVFGSDQAFKEKKTKVTRVIPMAYWSGIVKTDVYGNVKLDVPINDYSGKVRITVVGWTKKRTGSADKKVPVYSPIDLFSSLPRVFGVFDSSKAVVETFNNTDKKQEVTVSINVEGNLQVLNSEPKTIQLLPKRAKTVTWDLKGMGIPGKAVFRFKAVAGDEKRIRKTEILLRPAGQDLRHDFPFILKPGQDFNAAPPKGMAIAKNSGQWRLSLSGSPVVKISKHLKYLISYPHGCAEQTTSRLFAMALMKPTLGKEMLGVYLGNKAHSIDHFVNEGIHKLSKMQMSDGGFAYWLGGNYQYQWLNPYVTHFLWKAKQLNYEVPDQMIYRAINKLKSQYNSSSRVDIVAYSGFVLSLFGELPVSDLEKVVNKLNLKASSVSAAQSSSSDTSSKKKKDGAFGKITNLFSSIFTKKKEEVKQTAPDTKTKWTARQRIAGPFANASMRVLGEKEKAKLLFVNTPINSLDSPAKDFYHNHHFLYKNAAIAATLYGQSVQNDQKNGEGLMDFFNYLAKRRGISTHTAAWSLLAVDEIFGSHNGEAVITVTDAEGSKKKLSDKAGFNYARGSLSGLSNKSVLIKNQSPPDGKTIFGNVTFKGPLAKPVSEGYANNIHVKRFYFSEYGEILNPPVRANQGERIYAAITVKHDSADFDALKNVAIEDWLPAGFELENPNIITVPSVSKIPGILSSIEELKVDHVDYLDDRVAIFATLDKWDKIFIYSMRATSLGKYQIMPVSAESMYIPKIKGLYVNPGFGEVLTSKTIKRNTDIPNVKTRIGGPVGAYASNFKRWGGPGKFVASLCNKLNQEWHQSSALTWDANLTYFESVEWEQRDMFKKLTLATLRNSLSLKLLNSFYTDNIINAINLNCSVDSKQKLIDKLEMMIPLLDAKGIDKKSLNQIRSSCMNYRINQYYEDESHEKLPVIADNPYLKSRNKARTSCQYYKYFKRWSRAGVKTGTIGSILREYLGKLKVSPEKDTGSSVSYFIDGVFGGTDKIANHFCQSFGQTRKQLPVTYNVMETAFSGTPESNTSVRQKMNNIWLMMFKNKEHTREFYLNFKAPFLDALRRKCPEYQVTSDMLIESIDEALPFLNGSINQSDRYQALSASQCYEKPYAFNADIEFLTRSDCSMAYWFKKYQDQGVDLSEIGTLVTDFKRGLENAGF